MTENEHSATAEAAPEAASKLFGGDVPMREALYRLRLRLLDLTARNRLLNFKHSPGKALQFIQSDPDAVFHRLIESPTSSKVSIVAVPEPERRAWVMRNGRLTKPDAREYASSLGLSTSYELPRHNERIPRNVASGSQLWTLYYSEELGKHCRKIEREAKLAIEETGANMLYLVFGFLEYPDTKDSDKLFRAPLVCVPVKMDKVDSAQYSTFHLTFSGEELADNLSLREKVRRDFGLSLPDFHEEGGSLGDFFEEVEDAIRHLPRWRVLRMASLTLLSFTNMLLVRDLDPDRWPKINGESSLLAHPIVRQVFEGGARPGESSGEGAEYGKEYIIDEHQHVDLPLVYDADSSQHSALIDAIDGKNLVIEGPPGTGKSQTITNLIASALHAGKKILFVAEKLAALEVVKTRLAQAGLENFILELHSNKTNKKAVLEKLSDRILHRGQEPPGLGDTLQSLQSKRTELKAYADLLNSVVGNRQELTVHQVLWKAERFRNWLGNAADVSKSLVYGPALTTTVAEFTTLFDLCTYLSKQYQAIGTFGPEYPFWGFFPEILHPGDDLKVEKLLAEYAERFEVFSRSMASTAAFLGGGNLNMSADSANRLANVLANLAPANASEVAFELLPALFSSNDPSGSSSGLVLKSLRTMQDDLAALETRIAGKWNGSTPASAITLHAIKEHETLVRQLGLADCTATELQNKAAALNMATAAAVRAIGQLEPLAREIGIVFQGTSVCTDRLRALVEIADAAPDVLLSMRHPALGLPQAFAVLSKAHAELAAIQNQEASLDERLYLDEKPSESDLKNAILTLREGDAWYRIFQGKWRRACGLHRRIERSKSKKTGAERLAELEELLQYIQRRQAWSQQLELHSYAGPHFCGEETPLAELVTLAGWIHEAGKRAEQVDLPFDVFDPVTVTRSRLAHIRTAKDVVVQELLRLDELKTSFRAQFPLALASLNHELGTAAWATRIKKMQEISAEINALSQQMQAIVAPQVGAGEAIEVTDASHRILELREALANHVQGRALLGTYFDGATTRLDPIEAAHTYGRLIKGAHLPAAIEKVLVSEASTENYAHLTKLIEEIGEGWGAATAFAEEMGKIGMFKMGEWVCTDDTSHSVYASRLAEKTRSALNNLDALFPWALYLQQRVEAEKHDLIPYLKLVEAGELDAKHLPNTFGYRFYASIALSLFRIHPELSRFNGTRHSTVRAEFAAYDKEIIKMRGQQIGAKCKQIARPPTGFGGARVDDKTEMELLRHLIPQQRPRVPVRKMLKRAGRSIQELKPCFMMGPQAVAQFLEPGHLDFDIVVMDEASQLKPEEAIGAIARGKQLIVVGDPKQLPPTSFFSRMAAPNDGDGATQVATDEAESILDVCMGHFQPIRTLRWHYRSRHESLIAFSNYHFYRGNLLVFPSPYPKGKALGLRYTHVTDGVYENQMNVIEARRVVDAVVEHVSQRPEDSLGVVTLNVKQRDLIAELLDERFKSLPQADEFQAKWDAEGMGLFIKNLENVQGDERDCIIISTTFGKAAGTAVVRQNFGPISREGGWRRLNVLFTRARKSVAVYSSMQPEDIVVDSGTPIGTHALRNYLDYARKGILAHEVETGAPPDSDFEIAVIDTLRTKGFDVTPQLGVAGFRIDIAVKHPDYPSGYLAAIECDGASYHSGVSVRDRDRIRQEILESLGWRGRIWRIWSTDWFRSPHVEAEKMFSFLVGLRKQPVPAEFIVAPEPEHLFTSGTEPAPSAPGANEDVVLNDVAKDDELPQMSLSLPGQSGSEILSDDEDLEIEVGDLVKYVTVGELDTSPVSIKITSRRTDPLQGLVAANTPLAQTLLGAAVGDTVVMRVPGQAPRQMLIKEVKRLREESLS
ncbi:MAG TPA: DUF4011 domain-containing protein [Noviherbaspirillum sp.]|nr:DUF4011 domain-containing protein [Noviherbaspirillum sp.]